MRTRYGPGVSISTTDGAEIEALAGSNPSFAAWEQKEPYTIALLIKGRSGGAPAEAFVTSFGRFVVPTRHGVLIIMLLVTRVRVESPRIDKFRYFRVALSGSAVPIPDADDVREAVASRRSCGALRAARGAARFVPFHRVFHSVELYLLVLVAAFLDLFLLGTAPKALLVGLLVAPISSSAT
jgi:hypothetical protein